MSTVINIYSLHIVQFHKTVRLVQSYFKHAWPINFRRMDAAITIFFEIKLWWLFKMNTRLAKREYFFFVSSLWAYCKNVGVHITSWSFTCCTRHCTSIFLLSAPVQYSFPSSRNVFPLPAYSSVLKTKVAGSSEKLVMICQTPRRHTPEDGTSDIIFSITIWLHHIFHRLPYSTIHC
jgi:hypothetical protein